MSKPKMRTRLCSSGSLEGMRKLIADFYACKPERITLIDHHAFWAVQSSGREVTPIVVQDGKRYVFGKADT